MIEQILNNWLSFTIVFGLLLIVTFVMTQQSRHFYTKDIVLRKFSIMELEIPSTPAELVNLIKGLYFSGPQSGKSISSLKQQLRIDFLFMPLAYSSVFLICWKVAQKTTFPLVHYFFILFAFLQVVPWICDIIENVYLLRKIGPDPKLSTDKTHKHYLIMESFKWGLSLAATVSSISAICYYWLTGSCSRDSVLFLGIVAAETIIFLAASVLANKRSVHPIPQP